MTFESDEARRAYFLDRLRAKLADPEFRKIEGFPIGEDEDILRLSDPPYYTACPNPFIEDFIRCYGRPYDPEHDGYHREPFAADVSEGKSDPIYNAHSYHTKVPHKAIMRYILHYTEPGDIVYDGFCGSGMTGVAAQLCGDAKAVQALGYRVEGDTVYDGETAIARLGARRAVLVDLSPAATFIAYNYNVPVDVDAFQSAATGVLDRFDAECGWMYRTRHSDGRLVGRINYVIWSDVFLCPQCQCEVIFWLHASEDGQIRDNIGCPNCGAEVSKRSLERAKTTVVDRALGRPVPKAKRVPVVINYAVGQTRFEKAPDEEDLSLLDRIEHEAIPVWYPTDRIDRDIDLWYERDYRSLGIYTVDSFFHQRSLMTMALLQEQISSKQGRVGALLRFWLQSVLMGFSLLNRYRAKGYSQVNQILSGTLYVGAVLAEISPWYALVGKIARLRTFGFLKNGRAIIATRSATASSVPDASVDYIFTDPPFGSNIIYSDLSIIWESWLRLSTNTGSEAVVHRRKKAQASTLGDYAQLMASCFAEMRRVLKPGRWITVEFHNSKNSVWNAIQVALQRAGLVVADVRTLDKQTGTFKQVTASGAVKQDLVVSAYKPDGGLEERFQLEAGTEEGAWDFARAHLQQLPVFVLEDDRVQMVPERMNYLLFDRMVAFHVERGVTVPLSASEFYTGLKQRFVERDGMYFLPEQAAEYDQKRAAASEVMQLQLIITGEESAIQWLRLRLDDHPQTFQELHPQFMRELAGWQRHERPLELAELLEQNFLCYDGVGALPAQIRRYLSASDEALRDLPAEHPALLAAARDRWYVPDPNRAGDLEKLRERALLREFDDYRRSKERKLKVFRLEAVRAGFRRAWQEKDYQTILEVAAKIPDDVLQEDAKLLMWREQARTRVGEA
ncbi:MAG TPA: DNA methyltransferase [Anaerolineae bacterium]|nr:DNA methyltransferase [Anaerolineae bacterium]